MTHNIIATGSSGNAVLINDSILIDCGVPMKKLEPYTKDLCLVLLTHVHGDHFKPSTVAALHKRHPGIRWGCCEWMVGPLLEAGVSPGVIDVMSIDDAYDYWAFTVSPFFLMHNVKNCGWRVWRGINVPDNTKFEAIFYATDCATLDGIEAKDYDYYLIEANHTRAEIEARIAAKRAAGEFAYEEQAMHNHLSQEQALDWLAENMGPNSKYVFLHQHQEKEKNDGRQ